ncbi:MAG TPA: chaperone NapD [Bosea sp. (in: a-proteobacteria)]|jgi:nitrate reductase NapD|uniref:chaperone NapD n=1 Tax=Bosea sp. (in: a-proteobacteria) TaxID=1871050 RepID=UPI002E0F36A0|nr:chaperone NapD [Bosea sp. (in: a-proteobacteria)]
MSAREHGIDRRDFLTGRVASGEGAGQPGPARLLHIASAVVTARAEDCPEIARRIAELPGTEIHGIEGTKIIVVMESENSGEIGTRLTQMALMDRVFSANLVFEQIETLNEHGGDR